MVPLENLNLNSPALSKTQSITSRMEQNLKLTHLLSVEKMTPIIQKSRSKGDMSGIKTRSKIVQPKMTPLPIRKQEEVDEKMMTRSMRKRKTKPISL